MATRTVRISNPARYRGPEALEKSVALTDFTGGLDLFRDGGQLTPEYTADVLNVEFLPGGGFARRKAVRAWTAGTEAAGKIRTVGRLETADGTNRLLVSVGDGVYNVNPDTPNFDTQLVTVSDAGSNTVWRSTQANYKAYLQNGTSAPKVWNGTTLTALAQGFNNTSPKYGTYSQGKMPIAKHMAVWHGRMWAANIYEDSTNRRSRMRFSFPMINGIGETDWHGDDFFEVDPGVDGDEITALVPAGDRLYIFKAHSVHQVQGWDESNFEVFPVVRTVGAESPEAIAVLGTTVYFWDDAKGLVALTSEGLSSVFRPLERLLPSKEASSDPEAVVGVVERRVWVTFTEPSTEVNVWYNPPPKRYTYVFDPALSENGSWTRYDIQASCYYQFHYPLQNRMVYLYGQWDSTASMHLVEPEIDADYDALGNQIRAVASYLRTAWLADGTPYSNKRWLNLRMVLDAGQGQSFDVAFFRNWDETQRWESLSVTEADTTVSDPFVVDSSLIAPPSFELKRPVGYGSPGAYLGYEPGTPPYPGSDNNPTYNTSPYNSAMVYDTVDAGYDGSLVSVQVESTTGPTDYQNRYVPLSYTQEPCLDADDNFAVIGPVRDSTLLVARRITMRQARAVQMLFQGSSPSKRWAVRAIMVKYRLLDEVA